MTQGNEKVIKKGKFKVVYSSAKKCLFDEGELILTKNNLSLKGNKGWEKSFLLENVRLGVWGDYLEIRDSWYGKLFFKLAISDPITWRELKKKIHEEEMAKHMEAFYYLFSEGDKVSVELKKFFNMSPEAFKTLYNNTRKEREQYQRKNIKFNLDIQSLYHNRVLKNRKLKAFLIAHNYVAWYEWTIRILEKVFKAKFGKGPKNDAKLLSFLNDYPRLKGDLDTSKWGLKANQIRNCVAHERFYFDYKNSELIFMLQKEEKRVKIRDLFLKIIGMSRFYVRLLEFIAKGKSGKS